MQEPDLAFLGPAIALVLLGLALVRTYLTAEPKRPRLARWSLAGALVCFFMAGEILVCVSLPGRCANWWPYGISGAAVFTALFTVLWLELRVRRRQRIRIKEVAAELRDRLKKLGELYQQAKDDPSTNAFDRALRAADRADTFLVPWKVGILEDLDAAVSRECAMQCYRLGTELQSGAPGANAKNSYEVHRGFLERQLARIERGKIRLKDPPESSGEVLPHVRSFVYPPQP